MARTQDPFLVFQEEAIGWWDEPGAAAGAAAVAAFQAENALLPDGIAGSSTAALLREVIAGQGYFSSGC